MKLTKKEILDFETEYQLIKTKIRDKLDERGMPKIIFQATGIDETQLSNFKHAKRDFSLKRLLQIAKIITKGE